MPDEVLKEQCRRLYLKHKNALDLIFRYGEVNAFESAANQFFDKHKELKHWQSGTSRASFLPTSLLEVIPPIEGVNWHGQSRPILYWFNLVTGKLGLILEVGPFSNSAFSREALVKKLLDHFKVNTKIYPKYTRVYSTYRKLNADQASDPEEILALMNGLYEDVVTRYLAAVTDITGKFFQQKTSALDGT